MLSAPDVAVIGVLALLFFGPDQLPKVAKRVGHIVREVQNTSASFLRELERAADDHEPLHAMRPSADVRSSELPEDMRPSELPEDMRRSDLSEDVRPAERSTDTHPADAEPANVPDSDVKPDDHPSQSG